MPPALRCGSPWQHCPPVHAGAGHDHGDGAARQPQRPEASARRQRLPAQAGAASAGHPHFDGHRGRRPAEGRRTRGQGRDGPERRRQGAAPTPAASNPAPRGLPGAGQAVRKGEVLAYVLPTTGAIERSNQLAQQAELRAARALADKRVARLKELADTVPRKDIEAAEVEAGQPDRAYGGHRQRPVEPRRAGGTGLRRHRIGTRRGRPGGGRARTDLRSRRPEPAAHRGAGL